jgi:methyltransferase (TIGR00027 family)
MAARNDRLYGLPDSFFDDEFLAAANDGVRQVVILAAGLDSRAWRLPWPPGTMVFEFKASTMQRHGARPMSTRVDVPVGAS